MNAANSHRLTTDDSHNASGSLLDVFVYTAHLPPEECADIIRLTVRDLGQIATKIWIIVGDQPPNRADGRVNTILANEAALLFRLRCAELESAPGDLLVCFGRHLPTADVIGQLRETLRLNPMASAAVPRTAVKPNGDLVIIGGQPEGNGPALIDRSRREALDPVYEMQENLFPCMLLAQRIVGNVDPPADWDHFPDLILAYLRAARRRGLLLVIDNTAVVLVDEYAFDRQSLLSGSKRMERDFPEYGALKIRLARHPAIALEQRLRLPPSVHPDGSPTLLLDCSHLEPIHNGSAECAMGILHGIHLCSPHAWRTTAVIADRVRSLFRVDDRFPTIRFVPPTDRSYHDVALRLGQSWSIRSSYALSQRGRSFAVTILDIIGIDISYAVPAGGNESFQFVGEHADGVIYISEFSRRQFHRRYFTRPDLIEAVIHLSLDPADYVDHAPFRSDSPAWILVLGNAFEHKDLPKTVDIIASAFPLEQFKVVGLRNTERGNVEVFPGGKVPDDLMDQLYAGAKCIIFPSFYEGFGLPIVKGLALGKTVIARRSELLYELAANLVNQGRLIGYANSMDLPRIIADLLAGKDTPDVPLGGAIAAGDAPYGWKSCGARVLSFAARLRAAENPDRWLARDRAFRYALAESV
jgi:glycosyltransferase involved in cell wall biosynthesis